MKKFFVVLLGVAIFCSCDKSTEVLSDDNIKKAKSESETVGSFASVEDLFEFLVDQAADIEISEDEILEGQLSYIVETGEVTLLTLEQKEPDFFIIPGIGGGDGGDYQVTCCCNAAGNEIFDTTCDSKWSCGKLIFDCLQANACAEICAAAIYFHPHTGFFAIDQTLSSVN